MKDGNRDWCYGCETPMDKRKDLPKGWDHGDPIPDGLTVHNDADNGAKFVFRHNERERVYL